MPWAQTANSVVAAAEVDDERSRFLLLVGQEREGGGQAVEHDVIHLQLEALDGADRILQPVEVAVNHMNVHLDLRPSIPTGFWTPSWPST